MGASQLRAILYLLIMCVSVSFVHAQPYQTGFLSIDCGSDAPHTDTQTTINWVPDTTFITTGHNTKIPPHNLTSSFSELATIRVFTDSALPKYCYTLPVIDNSSYTIRTTFFYGNSSPPSFKLALDAAVVANVTGCGGKEVCEFEYTYLAKGEVTFLCLVRDGTGGDPFVSAISLRPAREYRRFAAELVNNKFIWTRGRYNFGGADLVRFPLDAHNRHWTPVTPPSPLLANTTPPLQILSTTQKINLIDYGTTAPERVLQTALTAVQGNLTITLPHLASPNSQLFFHFAELDNHTSRVSRKFMLKVPGVVAKSVNVRNFSEAAFKPIYWYFWGVPLVREGDVITLYPKPRSRLGPLLNALEVFSVSEINDYKTVENDAQAIEEVKKSMNLTKWAGDPCLPVPHSWIKCTSLTEPKVDQVNLSGYNLQGTIPGSSLALLGASSVSLDNNSFTGTFPNVSSMMNLQQLHLHNNQLSGELPKWLANMRSLRELSIQNNNFSGVIPTELLSRSLNFTYRPGNPLLVEPNSTSNMTVGSTGTKPVVFHSAYTFVTTVTTIMTTLYM